MNFHLTKKHVFLGLGLMVLFALIAFASFLGYLFINERQIAYYPGSTEVSTHQVVKFSPYVYFRHNSVYRTSENFPKVYRWYANEFGLLPTAQWQSNCDSLRSSETIFFFVREMTVGLCETSNGRLIFTERSWKVVFP